MSSESNSNSNKKDSKKDNNFNPLIEGMTLTQSVAISLIDAYSEFVRSAPKFIEYWYNLFWNPWTTKEEQRRNEAKVE